MAGELGPGDHRDRRRPRRGPARSSRPASTDKAAGLLVLEGVIRKGAPRAHHPRRRHRLQDDDRLAAALQGRRRRSPRRPRMRRAFWPTPTTSSRATISRCSRSRSASGRCRRWTIAQPSVFDRFEAALRQPCSAGRYGRSNRQGTIEIGFTADERSSIRGTVRAACRRDAGRHAGPGLSA